LSTIKLVFFVGYRFQFFDVVNEAPPAFKIKDTPKPLRRSQFSSSGSVDFTSFCNRSGGNDSGGSGGE